LSFVIVINAFALAAALRRRACEVGDWRRLQVLQPRQHPTEAAMQQHLLFAEARRKPRVAEFGGEVAARLAPFLQLAGHVQTQSVVRVTRVVSSDVMIVTRTATVLAHLSVFGNVQ